MNSKTFTSGCVHEGRSSSSLHHTPLVDKFHSYPIFRKTNAMTYSYTSYVSRIHSLHTAMTCVTRQLRSERYFIHEPSYRFSHSSSYIKTEFSPTLANKSRIVHLISHLQSCTICYGFTVHKIIRRFFRALF